MKNFKLLKIWQKGFEIAVKTYQLVDSFPKEHKYGLSAQMVRAATSISSNIAEGSSRNSEKDYARFLEISLGSAFELETQMLISEQLDYGKHALRNELLLLINEEGRMINALIAKLKN